MKEWKTPRKYPLTFSCDQEHERMLEEMAEEYKISRSDLILELIGSAYIALRTGGRNNV